MYIKKLKKRSGGYRTIYALSHEEGEKYRELLNKISQTPQRLPYAHGFFPLRSIVTNATQHVNKAMTVNVDLKDFFDSVKPSQVKGKIPAECFSICFLDKNGYPDSIYGAPRQGLPTSPAIANIAAGPMDTAIVTQLTKYNIPGLVYTRYADDLSVSCDVDDQETAETIKTILYSTIKRCGFQPNLHKTRVLRAKNRREICGVMVDKTGLHISRRQRRKLRAATYNYHLAVKKKGIDDHFTQKSYLKMSGLSEFAKLKVPNGKTRTERKRNIQFKELEQLKAHFKITSQVEFREKYIPDMKLGEDCFITNDPVMIYGQSVFTTGWTSCMKLVPPYRTMRTQGHGSEFWQRHPGVSMAYIHSGETMTVAGIRRPRMKARCMVYIFESGELYYDHIYDNSGHRHYVMPSSHPLATQLSKAGFSSVYSAVGIVKGEVEARCAQPYFDSLTLYVHYINNKNYYKIKKS
jgi:hypothetical protein